MVILRDDPSEFRSVKRFPSTDLEFKPFPGTCHFHSFRGFACDYICSLSWGQLEMLMKQLHDLDAPFWDVR